MKHPQDNLADDALQLADEVSQNVFNEYGDNEGIPRQQQQMNPQQLEQQQQYQAAPQEVPTAEEVRKLKEEQLAAYKKALAYVEAVEPRQLW